MSITIPPGRASQPLIYRLSGFVIVLLLCAVSAVPAARWSAKLDGKVRFYQSTELGVHTDLGRGNGLAGVNINTGSTERSIRLSAPDDRFLSDEEVNLLYVSQDNRLLAYALNDRE